MCDDVHFVGDIAKVDKYNKQLILAAVAAACNKYAIYLQVWKNEQEMQKKCMKRKASMGRLTKCKKKSLRLQQDKTSLATAADWKMRHQVYQSVQQHVLHRKAEVGRDWHSSSANLPTSEAAE